MNERDINQIHVNITSYIQQTNAGAHQRRQQQRRRRQQPLPTMVAVDEWIAVVVYAFAERVFECGEGINELKRGPLPQARATQ